MRAQHSTNTFGLHQKKKEKGRDFVEGAVDRWLSFNEWNGWMSCVLHMVGCSMACVCVVSLYSAVRQITWLSAMQEVIYFFLLLHQERSRSRQIHSFYFLSAMGAQWTGVSGKLMINQYTWSELESDILDTTRSESNHFNAKDWAFSQNTMFSIHSSSNILFKSHPLIIQQQNTYSNSIGCPSANIQY